MTHTDPNKRYIIIGGGIAGVSAAEAIHAEQPESDITLISEEPNLPYFRMSLTRYLAGEVEREKLELHNQQWYLQNHIAMLVNTHVDSIDAQNKRVSFAPRRCERLRTRTLLWKSPEKRRGSFALAAVCSDWKWLGRWQGREPR